MCSDGIAQQSNLIVPDEQMHTAGDYRYRHRKYAVPCTFGNRDMEIQLSCLNEWILLVYIRDSIMRFPKFFDIFLIRVFPSK